MNSRTGDSRRSKGSHTMKNARFSPMNRIGCLSTLLCFVGCSASPPDDSATATAPAAGQPADARSECAGTFRCNAPMPELALPSDRVYLTARGDSCNRPHSQGEPVPEPDGAITDHVTKQPIGSWQVSGAKTKVCIFEDCASCTSDDPIGKSKDATGCQRVSCDAPLTLLEWGSSLTLIGVGNECTSPHGVKFGRDGSVTAKGHNLGSWSGSYSSLRFCTPEGVCSHCAP